MAGNHPIYHLNLPFQSCDNCDIATFSQDPTQFANLYPTCTKRPSKLWDENIHRIHCDGWELRRKHFEEEGGELE
jgi:hypothetical protein